jgi:uncharacterized membrane protein
MDQNYQSAYDMTIGLIDAIWKMAPIFWPLIVVFLIITVVAWVSTRARGQDIGELYEDAEQWERTSRRWQ